MPQHTTVHPLLKPYSHMKKSILLLITLLLSLSLCAQTEEEIKGWAEKGIAAYKQGNHQEAILYFEKCKEAYEEQKKDDEHYGNILYILADCYSKTEDYNKAVEYGTKALEIRKATLGESHPDYATSLNNLAFYFSSLGDYAKAVEYETKAMEIRKATLGENHPDYTSALNNLATYYSYLGDYAKAVEYGTKALEIRKRTLGENHPSYATSLDNLAGFFSDLGYHAKASSIRKGRKR